MTDKISLASQMVHALLAAGIGNTNDVLHYYLDAGHILEKDKTDTLFCLLMTDSSVIFFDTGKNGSLSVVEPKSVIAILMDGFPFDNVLVNEYVGLDGVSRVKPPD